MLHVRCLTRNISINTQFSARHELAARICLRGVVCHTAVTMNLSIVTLDLVYYVVKCFQAVLSVFGNGLTMVAILKYDFLKSATNVFIFSLALNDFQTGLLTPLSVVVNYAGRAVNVSEGFNRSEWTATLEEPHLGEPNTLGSPHVDLSSFEMWSKLCLAKEITGSLQSIGSIVGIFLISVDRFIFIEKPLRYHTLMNVRKAIGICVFMWTLSFVVGPVLLPFHLHLRPEEPCDTSTWSSVYFYGIATPFFTILTVTNVALYARIAFVAFKRASVAPAVAPLSADYKKLRRDNKITKMLCIVLGLYFVLYLPSILFGSFDNHDSLAVLVVLKYVSFLLWFSAMCVNPFIYVWKSKEFRKAFCFLLHLKRSTTTFDSSSFSEHFQE